MTTTTDDVYTAAARSLSRFWEAADHESQPAERPPGRRTVRAHRDPTVVHIAGTDRDVTTPGVTVVVDYTPGDGKAAMDALMSAVGEVRKQIEEER